MKGLLTRVWVWLKFNPALYQPTMAEYIRFGRANEYLITLYRLRWTRPKRLVFQSRVERCIGCDFYGGFLKDKLAKLKAIGAHVTTHPDMTLEEFTTFAASHTVLKNDSWVKMRLSFTNPPSNPEPGTS